VTLEELNAASAVNFVSALGAIYEHSPWVAEQIAAARPFATADDLRSAMVQAVAAASPERQFALIAGHPDLGGKLARSGTLEPASAAEQGGLGLDQLSEAEFEKFDRLNTAYRTRFGFPFIVAVKRHTRATVLAAFEERLAHTPEQERQAALEEIHAIAGFRLAALITG